MSFATKVFTVALTTACVLITTVAAEDESDDPAQSLARSNDAFAIDLYETLTRDEDNVFFSPFSINAALAMTYAGAGGDTADQMRDVFSWQLPDGDLHRTFGKITDQLGSDDDSTFQLHIANSIWGQKDYNFHQDYLDTVEDNYGAPLRRADFKSDPDQMRKKINQWVEKHTEEKIKDLMPKGSISPLTRLVLANAIYFNARWANTFDENSTTEDTFTTIDGTETKTDMMQQTDRFGYMDNDMLKILELPYDGSETSMFVLLPKEKADLDQIEDAISPKNLDAWIQKLKQSRVEVRLPKFKLKKKFMLNDKDMLPEMGMPDAFDPNRANFDEMAEEDEELYIAAAVHQAYVDVDEKGTEAAAATGIGVSATAAPAGEPEIFHADRPFIFLIRDRQTGYTLFMGRLADPTR
ncbi:MAG: serpin family protein [Planctomycetota bacterium]